MNTDTSSKVINIANAAIALTWLYHGIVPKLLHMETGELSMVRTSGMFKGFEMMAVYVIGVLEVLFGLTILLLGRVKILHYVNIAALSLLAITALIISPALYLAPFNPASTSFGVISLSLIVLILQRS